METIMKIKGLVISSIFALILAPTTVLADDVNMVKIGVEYSQMAQDIAESIKVGFTDDTHIVVGDYKRGWAERANNKVVIPLWSFSKGDSYARYYVCHEMAHIETEESSHEHGEDFQNKMVELCSDVYHYESAYQYK